MIWLTHMKTTIDIADPLLQRAKRLAAKRNTTLRQVIEDALRDVIAHEGRQGKTEIEIRTFRGKGLRSGLAWDDWQAVRDRAYEGRGA